MVRSAMDNPRSTPGVRQEAISEQDRDVRARVWRYIFDRYAEKQASQEKGPAHKEGSNTHAEDDGYAR
jgi:hypothetical protein